MSDDEDLEVGEGAVLLEDAQAMAVDAAALAINKFLFQLSIDYAPLVAFERAVDGETSTRLNVPSNLRIEMLP